MRSSGLTGRGGTSWRPRPAVALALILGGLVGCEAPHRSAQAADSGQNTHRAAEATAPVLPPAGASSLESTIAEHEYWPSEQGADLQAPNRRQDLRSFFGPTGSGSTIARPTEAPSWSSSPSRSWGAASR